MRHQRLRLLTALRMIKAPAGHNAESQSGEDAAEPGDANNPIGHMDAWEEHLAAPCVTLLYMEDLMQPANFLTLRLLVVEATGNAADQAYQLGMPRRHRGLFLPPSISEAPASQGGSAQVSARRAWACSGCLRVHERTHTRACVLRTDAASDGRCVIQLRGCYAVQHFARDSLQELLGRAVPVVGAEPRIMPCYRSMSAM